MSTEAAVLQVVSSPNDHIKEARRRTADFPKNIWGDRFLNYNYEEEEINRAHQLQEIQQLKEEVRRELLALTEKSLSQQLNLIDVIQRLGVGYHFQREIEQVFQQICDTYSHNDEDADQFDLHTVALFFRLLREHGHSVSCDIFNKFKDNKGNFKEGLTSDVSGMLSLYEAAQLGVHGEDILDEAITFTTTHLQSMVTHLSNPLASQIIHALHNSQRQRVLRIESRRDISIYEDDASHNQALLKLAKLDFNYLQSLHKQELSEICRWWKDLDLATKLPFARDRIVECYFWIMPLFHEPQYSLSRRIIAKGLPLLSAVDDIYDVYGTPEELNLFTEAIDRWDVTSMDQLPDYMQTMYKALWDFFAEVEELAASRGWSYRVHYAKEITKKLMHAYFDESKWFQDNRIPSMDEYMQVSLVSAVYNNILILSFVGMDCMVTEETLDWMLNRPTIIRAIELIGRVMNDITSHKFEQKRGHLASSVECYMKEYGVSEEEAYEQLYKLVRNSWKDVNKECLQLVDDLPAPILKSILNLGKISHVFYDEDDNYTRVDKYVKAYIESVLIDPIPI